MPASPSIGTKYGRQVVKLVNEAEIALLRLLADTLRSGDDTDGARWIATKLAELHGLRAKARVASSGMELALAREVRRVVREAYNVGSALAVKDLDKLGVQPAAVERAQAAADAIARSVVHDLHQAAVQLPGMLTDAYRAAVDAAQENVTSGVLTRRAASQQVLDDLLGQGIRGFTDTAGRSWALDTYAEMAIRTATASAAIAGHIATLQESGLDLVIVSTSPASCPLCDEWEGKILSTSGDTTGSVAIAGNVITGESESIDVAGSLQEATDAGLFHPNCTHTVDAYLPGATDAAPDAGDPPSPDELVAAESSDGSELFQATQRQRTIERTIRSWKRRGALALDDDTEAEAAGKVKQWQSILRDHVDANDLRRLPAREQIGQAH